MQNHTELLVDLYSAHIADWRWDGLPTHRADDLWRAGCMRDIRTTVIWTLSDERYTNGGNATGNQVVLRSVVVSNIAERHPRPSAEIECIGGLRHLVGGTDSRDMSTRVSVEPIRPRAEDRRRPSVVEARTIGEPGSTQRLFVFLWLGIVFVPWLLQVRSFVQLALPHTISPKLIASQLNDEFLTAELTSHCPVRGLKIAGVWWNIWPTHYAATDNDSGHICHFVVQQYNIHGSYVLHSANSTAIATAIASSSYIEDALPMACRRDADGGWDSALMTIDYYFYHGSIGYYSFFEQGAGVFCAIDETGYVVVGGLGSTDLNGNALARDQGSSSRRWSIWYALVGFFWVLYRQLVLRRSFILCRQYAQRCEWLREELGMRNAMVFVQESARLTPHGVNNLQRCLVLYFLIEGLMADLFLLIAKDGLGAHTQYISLGYNLAGVLSMLFEMIEATPWISERWCCLLRRLLFNLETGFIGELLCALLLRHYLESLNRSPQFRASIVPAQVVSFYVWSLVGHGSIVLGLASFILTVRAIGALVIVYVRFGNIRVLTKANCVDTVLRGRLKSSMLRGYIWRNSGLYYSRQSLKAYGLLMLNDVDNKTRNVPLVHHQANWISRGTRLNLMVVGHITGHHVECCPLQPCSGNIAFCDRMLGADQGDSSNRVENNPSPCTTGHVSVTVQK